MDKSKVFLLILLFFVGGIAYGSFFSLSFQLIYLGSISIVVVISLGYKNKKAACVAFLFAVFIFGFLHAKDKKSSFDLLKPWMDYTGKAEIISIKSRDNANQVVVKTEDFSKKILINVSQLKEFSVANVLEIKCDLQLPQSNENFDYKMYLAKEGIGYICKNPKITVLYQRKSLMNHLSTFRKKGELILSKLVPEPESGLAKGILFGGNDLLSENVSKYFSQTGTSHIVAVSGYNVTIIAEYLILIGIAIGFWRRQAVTFAIVGVFLFVMLVGFSASAVRAAVMASVLLWAIRYGRLSDSLNGIILSAAIMLMLNPLLLRWDIGFQLSFLATLGIVLISPLFKSEWMEKYKFFGMIEIAVLTICAQILVIPIIVYNFHSLSLISIIANVMILPLIPIAMLFSFLAAAMGMIWFNIGIPMAWFAYLVLHVVINIVKFLASFSWASIQFEINIALLILWYLLVFGIIALLSRKRINEQKKV